jgi:hypothetical protein
MPSRNETLGDHPSDAKVLTSSSFRGVPSGIERSNTISPS